MNPFYTFSSRIIENSLSFRGLPGPGDPGRWFLYDFFDIGTITNKYRSEIGSLKRHFTSKSEEAIKYTDDLFMVAPFYHRVFPYRKLIMLDVDLKFRIDIQELFQIYEEFKEGR